MAQGDFNRKAQQFMNGRRGPDDLANLCVWVAVILAIVDLFMHTGWLSWVSMASMRFGACAPRTSTPA